MLPIEPVFDAIAQHWFDQYGKFRYPDLKAPRGEEKDSPSASKNYQPAWPLQEGSPSQSVCNRLQPRKLDPSQGHGLPKSGIPVTISTEERLYDRQRRQYFISTRQLDGGFLWRPAIQRQTVVEFS